MGSRKFAVIFGIKYGLSDKIGKTEKQIRSLYGDLYHKPAMDALIADMKANGEIKPEQRKRKKKSEEGGE